MLAWELKTLNTTWKMWLNKKKSEILTGEILIEIRVIKCTKKFKYLGVQVTVDKKEQKRARWKYEDNNIKLMSKGETRMRSSSSRVPWQDEISSSWECSCLQQKSENNKTKIELKPASTENCWTLVTRSFTRPFWTRWPKLDSQGM